MTTFDSREQAFENKYAHDAEMQFRAYARRNRLLGVWAAELLGKAGDAVEAYAREVVAADLSEPGDDDVHRKVLADLEDAGASVDGATLRQKMDALLGEAKAQVFSETD